MEKETIRRLIAAADSARQQAYAPYSGFQVGCAVLCRSGKIYTGVNVENASYPVGLCAERAAFSAAVTAGERDFAAAAIIGGWGERKIWCSPCGMCRQFMAELSAGDLPIFLAKDPEDFRCLTLRDLLPAGFSLSEDEETGGTFDAASG